MTEVSGQGFFVDFGKDIAEIGAEFALNCTATPETCEFTDMSAIVSPNAPKDIYISPVGCYGIVRRKQERNLKINPRLEEVLLSISSQMSPEEIEKRSRLQKRGRFSNPPTIQTHCTEDGTHEKDDHKVTKKMCHRLLHWLLQVKKMCLQSGHQYQNQFS